MEITAGTIVGVVLAAAYLSVREWVVWRQKRKAYLSGFQDGLNFSRAEDGECVGVKYPKDVQNLLGDAE